MYLEKNWDGEKQDQMRLYTYQQKLTVRLNGGCSTREYNLLAQVKTALEIVIEHINKK